MEALFITPEDVKRFTSMSGNLDEDKFIQYVKTAQDLDIQDKLGSNLFEKISADIIGGTLIEPYASLVNTFIKPALLHWTMVRFLPFAPFTIANKGVFKHSSENSEGVSEQEITKLIEAEKATASHYTDRLIAYIINNKTDFPEYSNNTDEDMHPDTQNVLGGWLL